MKAKNFPDVLSQMSPTDRAIITDTTPRKYYFLTYPKTGELMIGVIVDSHPNDFWVARRDRPIYVDDEIRHKLVPVETPPEVPDTGPVETELDRLSLETTLLEFLATSLASAVKMHQLIPACWTQEVFGELIEDFRGRQNRLVEVCNEFLEKAKRLKRVLLIRRAQLSKKT